MIKKVKKNIKFNLKFVIGMKKKFKQKHFHTF